MKRILLALAATGLTMTAFAQTDSTSTSRTDTTKASNTDTIRIGGMVIVRKGDGSKNRNITLSNTRTRRPKSNLSTNWGIMDFGFSNVDDHTSMSSPEAQAFAPGLSKEALSLRTGKSVNVNIWFFMQRLNLVKHVVNLKYGFGLELNNYHFDNENVRISKSPTQIFLETGNVNEKKNKLAADYITVPMMLNFNFTPGRNRGFGFSAGISAGYLYSARQKIKTGDDKDKTRGNLGLEKWKTSAIAELSLGPIRLYGSHGLGSMWEKGLDQRPYNVGIRLSRW
ncbi:MAG: outer membrane protein beta-barrel protein [Flaviaesturariibacter sp.]|nr:outer membrane protein beta-barrel protein [Flaviaesturariibacter sp.]